MFILYIEFDISRYYNELTKLNKGGKQKMFYGSYGGAIIFVTYTNTLSNELKIKQLVDIKKKISTAYLQGVLDKQEWKHLTELATDCINKIKEESK